MIEGYAEVNVSDEFRQWLETLLEIQEERQKFYLKKMDERTSMRGWFVFKWKETDLPFRHWLFEELRGDKFFWLIDDFNGHIDHLVMSDFYCEARTIANLMTHSDKIFLNSDVIRTYKRLVAMMNEDKQHDAL